MKNKPCPFCQFDKSTELFYYDRWRNVIICRQDEHRLLAVRVGQESHKAMPTFEERAELMVPLIAVAEAQIKNGQATGYDIDEIVKEHHYHYYANLS